MIIGGKCSLTNSQIMDRINRGIKFLEFNTYASDFVRNDDKYKTRELLDKYGVTCYCVHAPMRNNNNGWCSLSNPDSKIQFGDNIELIEKSIEAASILCAYKNPLVVVHATEYYDICNGKYDPDIIRKQSENRNRTLVKLNDYLEENYPNIKILVENAPSFSVIGMFHFFTEGTDVDYPREIERLNLSNVGMILDICHAESVCRVNAVLKRSNTTILDYIDSYMENLELIHLGNVKDFGETVKKHSLAFNRNNPFDRKYLRNIFQRLKKLGYQKPITIEVLEDDYNKAVNYTKTLDVVKQIIKEVSYPPLLEIGA